MRKTFEDETRPWGLVDTTNQDDEAPASTPLMTFTLLDGGDTDEATLESDVVAAFSTARHPSAQTTVTPKVGGSTLRRILGTSDLDADQAVGSDASMAGGPTIESPSDSSGVDESGSLLRPDPAVDRLANQFTYVVTPISDAPPSTRGFLRTFLRRAR
jgi:hypothetical protein